MSQFQVADGSSKLSECDPHKLLEQFQLTVGLHPIHLIVLSHCIVVVLGISELIFKRSKIPLCCTLDVVVEAFVGLEVRQGKDVYIDQALDNLPLALGRVVKLNLACVVEQGCVRVELDLLVAFQEGFVHES